MFGLIFGGEHFNDIKNFVFFQYNVTFALKSSPLLTNPSKIQCKPIVFQGLSMTFPKFWPLLSGLDNPTIQPRNAALIQKKWTILIAVK